MVTASIIFAEDNILLRKFLRMAIQENPDLCVVRETADGLELLEQLEEVIPDLVILDISMPNLSGLDAAKIIKKRCPQVKIVILTMSHEKNSFRRAVRLGVDGYVLKEEIEDINSIVTAILQGKTYVSSYFQEK
jgi:DNA-binding NarL/FixJ family response regulator